MALVEVGYDRSKEPMVAYRRFNCTLSNEERSSSGGISNSLLRWTHDIDLIGLGLSRSCFTWNHSSSIDTG